jgi:hypothetical protein
MSFTGGVCKNRRQFDLIDLKSCILIRNIILRDSFYILAVLDFNIILNLIFPRNYHSKIFFFLAKRPAMTVRKKFFFVYLCCLDKKKVVIILKKVHEILLFHRDRRRIWSLWFILTAKHIASWRKSLIQ